MEKNKCDYPMKIQGIILIDKKTGIIKGNSGKNYRLRFKRNNGKIINIMEMRVFEKGEYILKEIK